MDNISTCVYNNEYNNEFVKLRLTSDNIKEILHKKYNYLIKIKEHPIHKDLLLVCNKWDTLLNDPLYRLLNSVALISDGYSIIPYIYTYPTIYNNIRDKLTFDKFLGDNCKYKLWESMEGTVITFFKHNDDWVIMTPRCFDVDKSKYGNLKSFGDQLNEILEENSLSRKQFLDTLDKYSECSHSFILIHRNNYHIVDYDNINNSKRGFLSYMMSRNLLSGKELEFKFEFPDNLIHYNKTIEFTDNKLLLDHVNNLLIEADNTINNYKIRCHGYIVKKESIDGNIEYYRVHSNGYKELILIKPNKNTQTENLIESFQTNNIKKHIECVGIKDNLCVSKIKCVFNFVSNCMYTLYYHFTDFDINTGIYKKINVEDYNKLELCKTIKCTISKIQKLAFNFYKKSLMQKNVPKFLSLVDISKHLHNRAYTSSKEIINITLELLVIIYDDKLLWKKLCNNMTMPYNYIGYRVKSISNYDLANSVNMSKYYLNELLSYQTNPSSMKINNYHKKLNDLFK